MAESADKPGVQEDQEHDGASAAESLNREREERRRRLLEYLASLAEHGDLEVLASEEMWR